MAKAYFKSYIRKTDKQKKITQEKAQEKFEQYYYYSISKSNQQIEA